MTPATRSGLNALGAGLAVGVVANLLLPVEPWGLNMLLCVAALLAAGAFVIRRAGVSPSPDTAWLAISILLLGAAFLRRDANMLQGLDFLALVGLFGLAGAAASGVSLRRANVGRYIASVGLSAGNTLSGGLRLIFGDVAWREVPIGSRLTRFRGIALGALIAVPLLLVFGTLLSAADPVFGQALGNILSFDLSSAAEHTFRTAVLGGLAAGYLRGIVMPAPVQPAVAEPTVLAAPRTADASVPVVTALVLLNALFLAFVAVQLRYFFGGSGRVETVAGLTYAEYARSGFFELVWATAFVVPVLLGGDWAVRGASAVGIRRFRIAATATLGLMTVVMASAFERMRLYVAAFGLTEDRLYATAGMIFLGILLAWLGWTVLRGQATRFAFGATLQGLAVLGGLHALNPDVYILRHNLNRPADEARFDAEYASQLGADAAPLLLVTLPSLSPADACVVAKGLAAWAASETDWRTWNWSRSRAAAIGRDPIVAETVQRCGAQVAPPSPQPLTPSPS